MMSGCKLNSSEVSSIGQAATLSQPSQASSDKSSSQETSYDESAYASQLKEKISTSEPVIEKGFSFDPKKYELIESGVVDRTLCQSLDELEERLKTESDGYGIILTCQVAGDSINRIMEPPKDKKESKLYGVNHVLTPIKIQQIIYKGSKVALKAGDIIYVIEPFFYVTEETPDYLSSVEKGTYVTNEYDPMVKKKIYLMYAKCKPAILNMYDYDGQTPLTLQGLREAVYCLSDESPQQNGETTENYFSMWNEAKRKYSDLLN